MSAMTVAFGSCLEYLFAKLPAKRDNAGSLDLPSGMTSVQCTSFPRRLCASFSENFAPRTQASNTLNCTELARNQQRPIYESGEMKMITKSEQASKKEGRKDYSYYYYARVTDAVTNAVRRMR